MMMIEIWEADEASESEQISTFNIHFRPHVDGAIYKIREKSEMKSAPSSTL